MRRYGLAALLILGFSSSSVASPTVTLPNGELGSLHDLIRAEEHQARIKRQGRLAPASAPQSAPFGEPGVSIESEGEKRKNPTKKVQKAKALQKRGLGCWGDWGGVTDVQAVSALKELTWWYSWNYKYPSAAAGDIANRNGIEFVPMLWNTNTSGLNIPPGTQHLLGYNEPNVRSQGNVDPMTAAKNFDKLFAIAKANNLMITGHAPAPCPGVDYSTDCVLRSPWDWWDQYNAACAALQIDCTPDFVATHLYTCSPTTLVSYIDALWRRFKRPIWITEFACCTAGSKESADETLAKQIMYMRTAMDIMDKDPRIYRYSWFAPRVTDFTCLGVSANLLNADGSKTTLGKVYTNSFIDTWALPFSVSRAVTADIPSVPLVNWGEACRECDASSSFWNQEALLKKAGNSAVYREFVETCRLCGYEDEWNGVPLL